MCSTEHKQTEPTYSNPRPSIGGTGIFSCQLFGSLGNSSYICTTDNKQNAYDNCCQSNLFVDSLTHDSIIVQIPRLHGKINNRLDEVLSIFDQTRKDAQNQQMLHLDDSLYPDDDVEMQHILRRLLMAATNAEMRMDMNVEDEYFSIIEKRDTEIMQRDWRIAEQNAEITKQNAEITKQNAEIAKQNAEIANKNKELSQKDEQLRKSVKMLLQAHLSIEQIASSLGVSPTVVQDLSL